MRGTWADIQRNEDLYIYMHKRLTHEAMNKYILLYYFGPIPSGSSKLVDLERELKLLKGLSHPHILNMSSLYVDTADDALWIRMELMDRSLADVIGLIGEGLVLQEKHMAQVASDVCFQSFNCFVIQIVLTVVVFFSLI